MTPKKGQDSLKPEITPKTLKRRTPMTRPTDAQVQELLEAAKIAAYEFNYVQPEFGKLRHHAAIRLQAAVAACGQKGAPPAWPSVARAAHNRIDEANARITALHREMNALHGRSGGPAPAAEQPPALPGFWAALENAHDRIGKAFSQIVDLRREVGALSSDVSTKAEGFVRVVKGLRRDVYALLTHWHPLEHDFTHPLRAVRTLPPEFGPKLP